KSAGSCAVVPTSGTSWPSDARNGLSDAFTGKPAWSLARTIRTSRLSGDQRGRSRIEERRHQSIDPVLELRRDRPVAVERQTQRIGDVLVGVGGEGCPRAVLEEPNELLQRERLARGLGLVARDQVPMLPRHAEH